MAFIKYIFFIISFLIISTSYSQLVECGTIENEDPNFNILRFQEFKQKIEGNGLLKNTIFIPIKAHVFRTTSGGGGLSETELIDAIDTLNGIYAPTGIVFYLCNGINYVDNSTLFDFDAATEEVYLDQYQELDALNIYFFNTVVSSSGNSVCGYAHLPWSANQLDDYVAMKNSCAINGSTLSHEIGHFFGLYHTHQTSFGNELVNGSNCTFSGDLCCDTPADPTLSTSNVTLSCVYIGTEVDANGDSYNPDPTNLMSYSRKSCRNYLSPDQYARVLYYQQLSRSYLTCGANDIEVKNVLLTNNYFEPGASFVATFEQIYSGYISSEMLPSSSVGVYLSEDTIIDQYDLLLSQDSSELGYENISDTFSIDITLPVELSGGQYYIIFIGDHSNKFNEVDEENNEKFIQISVAFSSEDIMIYPNPVTNYLYYELGAKNVTAIEVYDKSGRIVLSETNIDGQIDFTQFTKGVYSVKFFQSDKTSTIFKVIK